MQHLHLEKIDARNWEKFNQLTQAFLAKKVTREGFQSQLNQIQHLQELLLADLAQEAIYLIRHEGTVQGFVDLQLGEAGIYLLADQKHHLFNHLKKQLSYSIECTETLCLGPFLAPVW